MGDIEILCDAASIEIGNRVWDDLDGDGEQDAGEPGLGNLTVTLVGADGTNTTTNTDSNGLYYFGDLTPYTAYTLTMAAPAGYELTAANQVALSGTSVQSNDAISDTIDSDAALIGGLATIYYSTGGPGQNNHGLDFGFTQPAAGQVDILNIAPVTPEVQIGDRLWIEDDNNGDAANGVIAPVGAGHVVTATASDGTTVYTSVTDANGFYTITVPANDTYTVTTDLPGGGVVDTPVQVTDGSDPINNNDLNHNRLGTTVVMTTTDNLSIDFGFFLPAQFGDRVWIESDSDGLASTGTITPVVGMVITATSGSAVYTTTTEAGGYYSFTVPAGSYVVTYGAVPSGYGAVTPSTVVSGTSAAGNAGSYAETGAPDANHGQNTTVTVAAGEANWHVDFAFYLPVALGDYVWQDYDLDGVQDATEPGVEGVTVMLTDSAGVTQTTTTDSSGFYSFANLAPSSTYTVTFTPPAGNSFTVQNTPSNDAADSDVDGSGVVVVTLGATDDFTIDAGLIALDWGDLPDSDSVGGQATDSPNYNTDSNGTTGASHVIIPGLYMGSTVDAENDGQPSNNAAGDGGDEAGVSLPAAFQVGSTETVTVSVVNTTGVAAVLYGFIDFDGSGTFEASETVTATVPDGTIGNILLSFNVPIGADTSQQLGARFRLSTDTDLTADGAASNGEVEDYLISLTPRVALGNYVWQDYDQDGVQDVDEPGVDGVTVTLTDSGGVTQTVVTSNGGYYTFTNLLPNATYTINFTPPVGNSFTTQDAPSDDGVDSDVDSLGVVTVALTTTNNYTIDAGLIALDWGDLPDGAASNSPEYNTDNSGTAGASHVIIPDLYMGNLVDAETDGQPNTTATGDDGANTPDDEDGVSLPDFIAGGTSTVTVTVTNLTGADATLYGFIDFDGSGTFEANESVTATVPNNTQGDVALHFAVPADADTTQQLGARFRLSTDSGLGADGAANDSEVEDYLIQIEAPTLNLGNRVWIDADGDGVQNDPTDPAAAGLTVTLLDATSVISTTTTDANGYYTFTGLSAGVYTVIVEMPSGYALTIGGGDPDDDVDTDSNAIMYGVDAASQPVTLSAGDEPMTTTVPGDSNFTVDFGFVPVSIGNYVWHDLNGDGLQDAGEPGIPGVIVELWDSSGAPISHTRAYRDEFTVNTSYAGSDGALDWSSTPWRETESDGVPTLGNIQIVTDLGDPALRFAGSLIISRTVDMTAFADGTATFSFEYRREDLELTGNTLNIEYSPDGGATWILLDTITGASNDTLYQLASYTINSSSANTVIRFRSTNIASAISDRIFIDNVQIAGNVLVTDVTDADGLYGFAGLDDWLDPSTDYQVAISLTQPALVTMTLTAQDAGGVTTNDPTGDDTDSDAIVSGGYAIINPAPSPAFGDNPSYDFGFYEPASLGDLVWEDLNGDGVQDAGEPGIPNVTVQLYDSSNTLISTTLTLGDGSYGFTNLVPGDYYVVFTPPAGYAISPQDQGDQTDGGAADSDPNPTTGETITTTLVSGENDPTWDAGLYQPVAIGNLVWLDDGGGGGVADNGILDGAEAGIDNVTVLLFRSGDDPLTATAVATTTTSGGGYYEFDNLVAGSYFVHIPAAEFQAGGDLENRLSSTGAGTDETTDHDGDENGADVSDPASTGVSSNDFDLQPNDEQTGEDQSNYTGALDDDSVNFTADFGFIPMASLGDYVWHDTNADGVQDAGETGVVSVTVELLDSTGLVIDTTETDATGFYSFTNLVPGDYSVRFTPPVGYVISPQDQGDQTDGGSADSDADPVTGETVQTTLTSGENDPTWDAGLYQPAAIGDYVWYDDNADGVQDAGETGVVSVTVELLDSTGAVIDTMETDATGYYSFTNLVPGAYSVRFDLATLPAGYQPSPQDQGDQTDEGVSDSDADVSTGATIQTTLDSGENDPTWDMGIYQPASLGDYVWYDTNADGVQDAGETGAMSVTVVLYEGVTSTPVLTTTTDSNGLYSFTDLTPGDYYVVFTAPDGYVISPQDADDGNANPDERDSDAEPTTGQTATTTLTSGENDPTWDAGLYAAAAIGDYVWYDDNADGVQDAGETGVVSVTVELLDSTGLVIDTMETDASGYYSFTNLVPGDYSVRFDLTTLPAGYVVSPQDQGDQTSEGVADSDADVNTGDTIQTTLDSGEYDPTWDMGIYQPASLGDFVWHDLNADGVQDGGETGVVSVTVELLDSTGLVIDTTETDATGFYNFTNLVPGDYSVRFTPPAGYVISPQDQGDQTDGGAADSDADPVTGETVQTTLTSGENDPTWDAGLYQPAAIGDYVWYDDNADGVQDPGETGVVSVTVELLDSTGAVIDTMETDATGYYSFTNLVPGDYSVRFDLTTLPAGYQVSPQDQGDQTDEGVSDSDADVSTGATIQTMLDSGEYDPTWDMGIYQPASLGDYVWHDYNQDGVQDAGEPGIPDVTVQLYDSSDTLISTTVTLGDGSYGFTDLMPGDYYVLFTAPAGYQPSPQDQGDQTNDGVSDSDADPTTGRTVTTTLTSGENDPTWDAGFYQPASLGDLVWEDLDGDGVQDAGEPGIPNVTVELYDSTDTLISTTVTLGDGSYSFINLIPGDYYVDFAPPAGYVISPQDVDDGNANPDARDSDIDPITGQTIITTLDPGENDPTWDAGLYQPAAIGDYVWYDDNADGVQDAGETGVVSVTVELLNGAGAVIDTMETDATGYYSFTNLVPGAYSVRFDLTTLPAGYQVSPQDQGDQTNEGAADSDADVTTGATIQTTLDSGENDPTWDMGIYQPASLGDYVWYDTDADGVQDAGETGHECDGGAL
ncbi:MAG: SdrD B-like domain-containing protein [Caldilineaceae bacterium]